MARWVWVMLLLAAGFALGQTALLIEDEPLALEYGAYLQVGGKTYKAVAVYIPTFVEAMYLPANTTVRVPLYGEKILFVPVEEAEPPAAVGYIATDKGRIIFTEDAPAIAFADTDNYTKITKHPVQKAKVVEKRLPPPRGLAPRPTPSKPDNQAARPETGVGEEGPAAASVNAQVAPLSLPTGTVVEAVGAIYTLGRINGGQYARPYNVTNIRPPCTPPGKDVHIIYLGYGVKHAAVGVAPVQSGQTRLNITIYSVENERCVKLDSLVYQYDSSWGRYFAYFIRNEETNKYPNPVSVSGKVLAVAIQNMGTAAVSLNISVAYHREVKAEYQTSNYNLQQAKFRVSSINYFSRVVFAPFIPPDGVTDVRLVVGGYLWADDASNGRCQYSRLNFNVYINGFYEGRGTAYCYAVSSSTCRCDFNYAYTYSSAPFSLRYAKGFGRGVVLVALEFKRPDGGAPRIRYFEGGLRVWGYFWREIYRSEYLNDWTRRTQTFAYTHLVGCASTTPSSQSANLWEVLVTAKSQGPTERDWHLGFNIATYVSVSSLGISRPADVVHLWFRHKGVTKYPKARALFYVYPSGVQQVQAPWWLEIGSAALDAISLLTSLLSGYAGMFVSLAIWATGKTIQSSNAVVDVYLSSNELRVSWARGFTEDPPRQVIIILRNLQGSDVELQLYDLLLGIYTGGDIVKYVRLVTDFCPDWPATSTGGRLPNLPEGSVSDMYIWWAFRGFTDGETFVIE